MSDLKKIAEKVKRADAILIGAMDFPLRKDCIFLRMIRRSGNYSAI